MRPSRSVSLPLAGSAVPARVAAALAVGGLVALVGCQPPPKPPAPQPAPAPMATMSQQQMIQQQVTSVDPRAKVGHVADVNAGAHMAAVAGISSGDVKVGDTISFLAGDHQTLANGSITSTEGGFLIVDYSVANGGRDPVDGDLAVTLPLGR